MDCSATSAALRMSNLFQDVLSTPGGQQQQQQQKQYEDMWSLERTSNHVLGDVFSIDDLLNFSSIPEEALDQPPQEELGEEKMDEDENASNSNSSSALSFDVVQQQQHPDEPLLPVGDISDLEWVSQIVDDSFVVDLPCSAVPPVYFRHPTASVAATNHSRSPSSGSITSGSSSAKRTFAFADAAVEVPSKARSKRARAGGHVWALKHLHLPEPISCSSVSSSSSCSSASSCLLAAAAPVVIHRGRGRPPLHKKKYEPTSSHDYPAAKLQKKKGRKPKVVRQNVRVDFFNEMNFSDGGVTGRRCSHCGVQKTPQWRAGPLGAKTLCNACGVRYKSGRLLPEYRPAISPTFLDHVHSNSHRKVLEMRRKKEQEQQVLAVVDDSAAAAGGGGGGPPSPPLSLPTPLPAQHMVF